MTKLVPLILPLDTETEQRRFWEVKQAMGLAKEAGFRVWWEFCNSREGLFTLRRNHPGKCFEVIAFRGLQAQAIRCDETTLIMLDESEADTAKWTGYALDVVRGVLGVTT